jgi:arylamine N-acetyltransferase
MVESSGGNGSYCFGLNGLFFQMLKGLGFRCVYTTLNIQFCLILGRVYAGSGRINEQAPGVPPIFHAFVHMILFVQPIEGSNTTYFVDVGAGPVRPILLEEGEMVMGASPTEHHVLTRTARVESSLGEPTGMESLKKSSSFHRRVLPKLPSAREVRMAA